MHRILLAISLLLIMSAANGQFAVPILGKPPTRESIKDLQAQVAQFPDAKIQESADHIAYTFSRGDATFEEVAHYVFTKEAHPAHPAVIFRSTRIAYAARAANNKVAGATGDTSKQAEFASWERAFHLFNDELFRDRVKNDMELRRKIQSAMAAASAASR